MAGRKSKCTPAVVKKICEALKLGATYELAAAYAGIGERTFYDWMEQKPQFSQVVEEAEAAGAIISLQQIADAAASGIPGSWRAASWKMERRWPQWYGRNVQQVELSGRDGGPIEVTDARAILLAKLSAQAERSGAGE